jgi:hypothetical protein
MNGQSMMSLWSVHHAWVYKVATVLLQEAFDKDETQKLMTKGNSTQQSPLQRTAACE